ncbi:MAG: hypothetical protein HDS97_07660 [Bacteroidales bacterium]|nr:hypothetical protein [Bacteroidales bacterium]
MAQLMSIYKYPTTYNGQLYDWNKMTGETSAFYCSSDVQGQIAKLMAELGLPKHLNVAYGTSEEGGSGADSKNIPRTLSAFGYTSGGSIVNYDSSVLIEELKKGYPVLVSGFQYRDRVNILGIKFSYTYYTGHQWLAHGLLERRRLVSHHDTKGKVLYTYYESVFYPRYNWGWNGACDGYFLSTVFDVNNKSFNDQTRGKEGEEDNFQFNTKLVINIRR